MTETSAAPLAGLDADASSFLLRLLDTPAPSGFEEPSAAAWTERAAEFAETRTDAVGNSFATVNAGSGKRLLITGHLDEIGLIVTKIDDDGFLRVTNIGGWDVGVLIGQRVRIAGTDGPVLGAVGRGAIHQLDADERGKMPKLKDLWIDIGAADAEEARARVGVGSTAVLDASPALLGANRLISRSLDDRIGAFIALEIARLGQGGPHEIVALGAVGEENFGAGAVVGGFQTQPHAAVAIDVTAASDTPAGLDGHTLELGKGPIITRGASTSAWVTEQLIAAAEAADIPYQLRGLGNRTSTDVDKLVKAGSGVACGLISVPSRYLHSPCEVVDLRDVRAAIDLIAAWTAGHVS